MSIDLVNRDPQGNNSHLGTLVFSDVISEIEAFHSVNCLYVCAHKCYGCWKGLCYNLATLCCGICLAVFWGCDFAAIAFTHVWCITPGLRCCEINCALCQRVYTTCLNCCITPCFESCGGIFHHFKRG